jgi:hypothetical protein
MAYVYVLIDRKGDGVQGHLREIQSPAELPAVGDYVRLDNFDYVRVVERHFLSAPGGSTDVEIQVMVEPGSPWDQTRVGYTTPSGE